MRRLEGGGVDLAHAAYGSLAPGEAGAPVVVARTPADGDHVEIGTLGQGGAGELGPAEHGDRLVVREGQQAGEPVGGAVLVDELPRLPGGVGRLRCGQDACAEPPERARRRVVRDEPPARDDEPGRIVGEAGEAVGCLRDECTVVLVRPAGEVAKALERLHESDSTPAPKRA